MEKIDLPYDSSDLITNAINFATKKHYGQLRKGTTIHYITHPIDVMQILQNEGCSEIVIAAGVLHDVLEDTNTTHEELLKYFGEDIFNLVAAESEDKSKTWKERKQATINSLDNATQNIKMICFADKLSNLRSMATDLKSVDEKLWDRFKAPKEEIEWYYRGVFSKMNDLSHTKIYKEYILLLENVFGKRAVNKTGDELFDKIEKSRG